MNKQLFIIKTHSFVDLITNSSSELFVCDSRKSIDAVKEIVVELAKVNNKIVDDKIPEDDRLFSDVLKEPALAPYNFDYFLFPAELREEYEKYHNVHVQLEHGWGGDDERNYEQSTRYQDLLKQDETLQKETNINEEGLYQRDELEYEKRRKIYTSKKDKLWKTWRQDELKSEVALYKYFLKSNGFSIKNINKVDVELERIISDKCSYYWFGYKNNKKFNEIHNSFHLYLNYMISVKKNDILIDSAGDNTVPGELINSICTYLNAAHYHIG